MSLESLFYYYEWQKTKSTKVYNGEINTLGKVTAALNLFMRREAEMLDRMIAGHPEDFIRYRIEQQRKSNETGG